MELLIKKTKTKVKTWNLWSSCPGETKTKTGTKTKTKAKLGTYGAPAPERRRPQRPCFERGPPVPGFVCNREGEIFIYKGEISKYFYL